MNASDSDDTLLTGGLPPLLWAKEGARQALTGPAWAVGLALVGVGGLAQEVGQSWVIAALSTLLVWAGPAQVIFLGSLAAGAAPLAIATAVSLSGVRFLPMVMSLLPQLRGKRTSFGAQLLAAHLIAVTVWTEGMRRVPDVPRDARMSFFLGFAITTVLVSTALTLAGYWFAARMPGPLVAGLLFLTPVYFVASLMRGAREAMDWLALFLGLALSPIMFRFIGGGLDLLGIGFVAGGGAYAVRRFLRRGQAKAS